MLVLFSKLIYGDIYCGRMCFLVLHVSHCLYTEGLQAARPVLSVPAA